LGGRYDVCVVAASSQKWPPAPSNFASRREKSSQQEGACKRLRLQNPAYILAADPNFTTKLTVFAGTAFAEKFFRDFHHDFIAFS
jgi:hypothetical protein